MSEAEKILKMIETVSPDDTAKLDEIDARVWCWLNEYEFVRVTMDVPRHPERVELVYFRAENPGYDASNYSQDGMIEHSWNDGDLWWAQTTIFKKPYGTFKGYTRSRDALKAIRPESFKTWAFFEGYREGAKYRAEMFTPEMLDEAKKDLRQEGHIIQTDWLPTEELAELHAIIQAIEYERKKS